MNVSGFLQSLADESGPEKSMGAIVLVALDRPIDPLTQQPLGLGPYHRGEKSQWSHTLLVADTFSGPARPSSTVRSATLSATASDGATEGRRP